MRSTFHYGEHIGNFIFNVQWLTFIEYSVIQDIIFMHQVGRPETVVNYNYWTPCNISETPNSELQLD